MEVRIVQNVHVILVLLLMETVLVLQTLCPEYVELWMGLQSMMKMMAEMLLIAPRLTYVMYEQ